MEATMNDVLWLAYRNREFLERLLASPEQALEAQQLQLDAAELKALKDMLNKKVVMDGKHILKLVNAVLVSMGIVVPPALAPRPLPPPPPPPPPPWNPDPPLTMPPPAGYVKAKARKTAVLRKKAKKVVKRVAKKGTVKRKKR